jgi:DNA primase
VAETDFKDDLKQRCDIVDIVNMYVPLKKMGANYKGLCPFHNEKTPSFTVNPVKQIFYCFGCHKGGDIFKFIMEYEHVEFPESMRILAQRAGIPIPESTRKSTRHESNDHETSQRLQLLELHEKLMAWYQQNLRSNTGHDAFTYLQRRGLTDDILVKFGIGYALDGWRHAGDWGVRHGYTRETLLSAGILTIKNEDDPIDKAYDRFRHRIMFPVWNELGRIVGFSGRILTADVTGGKYVNSPETPVFHKGKILYGLHLARESIREEGFALLCEGQMDVIACHQAGITNAIAPMGTAFTEAQAHLLKRYTDTIIIMFDGDQAGIGAAIRSIDSFLPAGLSAKVILLNPGNDPDSLLRSSGSDALRDMIMSAKDYFVFRVDLVLNELEQGKGIENLAQLLTPVLEDLAKVENLILKADFCRRIAEQIKLPEDIVRKELDRVSRKTMKSSYSSRNISGNDASGRTDLAAPSMSENAEKVLLEIALHHGVYAHQLLEDLPVDCISTTPVGQALNLILANTEQGKWADAADILLAKIDQYDSAVIGKALFTPEYGLDVNKEKLTKAYLDCLYRGMLLPNVEKRILKLQQLMKNNQNKEQRTRLQRSYIQLRHEKSEIYRKLETQVIL